jgi:large subunit ribosomal protein L14e
VAAAAEVLIAPTSVCTQALIDGPSTGVPRQSIAYKKVVLTPYVLKKLPRGARSPTVAKVWEASEIDAKWEKSAWNKKRQIQQTRRNLSDFDRFKVQVLKTQRRKVIGKGEALRFCGGQDMQQQQQQ